MEIENLNFEDISEIAAIEREMIGTGDEEAMEKTLTNQNMVVRVLKDDDNIIGFYETSVISPEAELYDIAVKKEFQGNGFGKLLVEDLILTLKRKNVKTVFLEVNIINSVAINLYQKFGFEIYDKRKKYYGDNDAILMKKTIE
ncbi:MAG: ribosomal protein S18-alanine N-acetyltransferase [Clostridia bacterium]|nr:ribosomal protein S18-alanine N-acetyltransferase [Clostridia bacterium]